MYIKLLNGIELEEREREGTADGNISIKGVVI